MADIYDGGELMRIRINSSLHRPDEWLGAERKPLLFFAMIGSMFFIGMSVEFFIMGIVVWLVFLFILRLMYKNDPYLRLIYLRNYKYKPYYPPHSGVLSEPKKEHHSKKLA